MTTYHLVYGPAGADNEAEPLTSPFEDWCETRRIHPEAPWAWEQCAHAH